MILIFQTYAEGRRGEQRGKRTLTESDSTHYLPSRPGLKQTLLIYKSSSHPQSCSRLPKHWSEKMLLSKHVCISESWECCKMTEVIKYGDEKKEKETKRRTCHISTPGTYSNSHQIFPVPYTDAARQRTVSLPRNNAHTHTHSSMDIRQPFQFGITIVNQSLSSLLKDDIASSIVALLMQLLELN